MIHAQTPRGAKDLILRGWKGPRGLKGFVQGRVTTPTGDKQFWDGSVAALSVTVDRQLCQGAQSSPGAAPVVTSSSTATATGGSAPYTYAWTPVSDDGLGGTWSAQQPNAAGTTFHASSVLDQSVATFRCTATDARGATGTIDVTAVAQNYHRGI